MPGRVPLAGYKVGVRGHHVAGQAQHQRHGVVSDRRCLGAGRVDHRHAAVIGPRQVHLVHSDADPTDDPEPAAAFQYLPREPVRE